VPIVFCQRHKADPGTCYARIPACLIVSHVFLVLHVCATAAVEYSQPHLINRKAIVQAFVDIKVKAVIGFGSVGTLKLALKPGTLCVSSDFVNFWTTISLSEDASAHIGRGGYSFPLVTKNINLVPGYNEALRKQVIDILTANNLAPKTEAVYVQTIGPRFETAAEIRVLATFGDIVGMTGSLSIRGPVWDVFTSNLTVCRS